MARSISEFIQEQESVAVNDNNMSDPLEKVYVESMIAFSTAQCTLEQAALIDFADEIGISAVRVINESGDEDTKTKGNIFKKAGNALKNAWEWFLKMISKLWGKITGFFTNKNIENSAKQYKSIFKQFAEKYPEVTDNMSSGDFYAFLKAKCPKATVDLTQKELTIWVKYNALVNAVKTTNELVDENLTQAKNLDSSNALIRINLTPELKKRISDITKGRYKEVQSKLGAGTKDNPGPGKANDSDVTSVSMGEILDAIENFESEKNLGELCKEGKRKVDELEALFKKVIDEDAKKRAANDANDAKSNKMADVSNLPGNTNTSAGYAIKENNETLEALKKLVNSLTTMEAEITKEMGPACAKFSKIAEKAMAEATENSEKGYNLNMESMYFV